MILLASVLAVFPQYTIEQLLMDVPETFLYQAERIWAARQGWVCVNPTSSGVDDTFRRNWEKIHGRPWEDES